MVKHILILGAGVAGLACAQKLSAHASDQIRITLVDESDVHVLKADLYEVATAFNKEITEECLVRLKATVATPISSLVDPECVEFIRDCVVKIDFKKKTVSLKKKKVSYDYLVVALGSVTNFFNIPGIEKSAYPLKTVRDALKLNCALDHLFFDLYQKGSQRSVHITIGGGGTSGVEVACELYSSLTKLCRKYHYPRSKVHVQLIQSGSELGGCQKKGTELIKKRLEKLGVCVYCDHRIEKVSPGKVEISDAQKKQKMLSSDLLVWTAGVQVNPVVGEAIRVNASLRFTKFPAVFAAGDNAYLADPRHKGSRFPMMAYIAKVQGALVAENILRLLHSRPLRSFKPVHEWLLIPLGGKFGLFKVGPILFTGFFAWLIRRFVILRYHLSVLPFLRALRKWRVSEKLFVKND